MKRSCYILFFLIAQVSTAKTFVLDGFVEDGNDKTTLIGANIVFYSGDELPSGTATDVTGYYQISLPPGEYKIVISYVGYADELIELYALKSNCTMDFMLKPNILLPKVVVKELRNTTIKDGCILTGILTSDPTMAQLAEEKIILEENNKAGRSFTVFPNPNTGKFTIRNENNTDNATYFIFNSNGRQVLTPKTVHALTTINLHLTSPGVYFMQNEDTRDICKIIITPK